MIMSGAAAGVAELTALAGYVIRHLLPTHLN